MSTDNSSVTGSDKQQHGVEQILEAILKALENGNSAHSEGKQTVNHDSKGSFELFRESEFKRREPETQARIDKRVEKLKTKNLPEADYSKKVEDIRREEYLKTVQDITALFNRPPFLSKHTAVGAAKAFTYMFCAAVGYEVAKNIFFKKNNAIAFGDPKYTATPRSIKTAV